MRDNPVKREIAQGGRAFGTMVFEFFTPGLGAIVKAAGADFVLYDCEHSGAGIETVKQQMAYCRGLGLPPYVRVPAGDYHFVARTLDAGAMGIMVPMVESAAQAKAIVDACRYPPKGKRGAAFGMAHDDYRPGPVRDTMAAADARTLVICLIETAAGIENVDAIADVDGVDVLWLGHFDLTNSMGIPAEFDHPRFVAAVDKVVAAAKRTGKTAGFMAADEAWGRRFLDLGFRLIAYGLDSALLQGALASGVRTLRGHNAP